MNANQRVFLGVLALCAACGEPPKAAKEFAHMKFANKTIPFVSSEMVACEGSGPSSYTEGFGNAGVTRIEFRKSSGEYFSINLPRRAVRYDKTEGFSPRLNFTIGQGASEGTVAWGI